MTSSANEGGPGNGMFPLFGVPYLEFLLHLNRHLRPRSYLEIGSNTGESLACFDCDAIAIDPEFRFASNVAARRKRTFLFQTTSDEFFRDNAPKQYFRDGVDLAFLDGMHRIEFLLRDFINVERVCHARSVILLHDCLPLNIRMARRQYMRGDSEEQGFADAWTGDVWKMLPILRQYRPDLRVIALDCAPTGLVAVTRLNPQSTVLADDYHEIVDTFTVMSLEAFGLDRLRREWPVLDSRPLIEHEDMLSALLTVY